MNMKFKKNDKDDIAVVNNKLKEKENRSFFH